MAEHNLLGSEGEREALLYLVHEGYTLHDRNWRAGHLELDIIAEWWGELVFVEVKTRADEAYAPAAEAVTLTKKRNLIAAAHAYMSAMGETDRPFRFDIITVVGKERPFRIEHLKDAYTEHEVLAETRRRRPR